MAEIICTVDAGLATIELNRPSASNALNRGMKEQLLAVLTAVGSDPGVRAVAITAAGKNFCVGQDLAEHVEGLRADPGHAMDTVAEHYNPIVRALRGITVPVVAGINGACVGAGLGLALAADIRIAAAGAKFGTAFTAIGLASDSGLSATLTELVGKSRAIALFLLGDSFDAATAETWGLVHHVVPDGEVGAQAVTLATRLAAGPTAAFVAVKKLIETNAGTDLDVVLQREADAQQRLGTSADHRAAVEAFLAKERPVFVGH
ncbi:MAG TPA: enoyl-CoA hydratase-related protein [Mycobacterium sp.]|nr:enoyl-CoA hydratase-related protein [Mycobacterium sp.]